MSKHKVTCTETFIQKASEVHNNFYDYSETVYVKGHSKVKITCPVHGEFRQAPHEHLTGKGCPLCSPIRGFTTQEFINRAKEVHGSIYDYSMVDYKRNRDKVTILCESHGPFEQRPMHHLNGLGCPCCATNGGFDPSKTGSVYILQSADYFKIGITNRTPEQRAYSINRSSSLDFNVIFSKSMQGSCAQKVERLLIDWLRSDHKQPTEKFEGYTETFYISNTTIPQIIDKLIEFENDN